MRLESLNCPNCHAPLTFSADQTVCICLYCNSTIRLNQTTGQQATQTEATAVNEIASTDMAHIKELLLAGDTEAAIEQYQQISGGSQSEAQAAITTLSNQLSFGTFRQQQLTKGGMLFFVVCLVGLILALSAGFAGVVHPLIVLLIAAFALLNIALFGKGFITSLHYIRAAKGVATVQFFTQIGSSQTGRRSFHVFRVILSIQPEEGRPFQTDMLLPVRDKNITRLHEGSRFEVKFARG
ncbi:MAG: hypothetical protein HC804_07170 [Anaerolineae bacterium]|nr:hypothetical protein [Anaerolineae bacterium]